MIHIYVNNLEVAQRKWNVVPRVGDSMLVDGFDEVVIKKIIWHTAIDGSAAVDLMCEKI